MKPERKATPEDADPADLGSTAIGESARVQGRRAARWGFGPETNPFVEGRAAAAWERGRRKEIQAEDEEHTMRSTGTDHHGPRRQAAAHLATRNGRRGERP